MLCSPADLGTSAIGDTLQADLADSAKTPNSTTPAAVTSGFISANTNATAWSSSPTSTTSASIKASASPTQSKSEVVVARGSNVVLSGISATIVIAAFLVGLV